jgi:CRP-like cAMP-binding protein
MSAEISLMLANVDLFVGLTAEERERIADLGRIEHWRADAWLMEEHALGPRMLVILEGRAEILRRDDRGVERVIAMVGRGEALGEIGLLLDLPRTATVRARTPIKAFAMDRTAFRSRVAAGDVAALKLGFELSRTLARRLMQLNRRITEVLVENEELRRRFVDSRQEVFPLWETDEP